MAGAGSTGEKNVMRVVEEIEGGGSVTLFEKPIDPVGPTREEIESLAEWEKNLFKPPEKE